MENAFLTYCKAGMQGYFEGLTDKPFVVDKSREWGINYGLLNMLFPNPKIICLVRDLRAIVSSYEKIYRKNPLKHDPVRDDSTGRGTIVHKRVDEWMMPSNTIGRAVERIFEVIRQGYDNEILFVKYEDLCLYPERTMSEVYQYLGITEYAHDFDNIEQITTEDDEVYGLSNDLHVIKPKLQLPTPDYKQVLGDDICKWLMNTYEWYFKKFNYK
jgi:sulfotransferase